MRVEPMLASLAEPPITQKGLVYEPKYDGIRAIVELTPAGSDQGQTRVRPGSDQGQTGVRPGSDRGQTGVRPGSDRGHSGVRPAGTPTVALLSRNGNDKTRQFPEIARALESMAARLAAPVVLDGEIVAIDPARRPLGFQFIQGRIHLTSDADIARAARAQPAVLVLFDLLIDGADDLRRQPMVARRLRLQQRMSPKGTERSRIWLSEMVIDDGRALLARARAEGWEGLIVKDAQSVYQSGRRTPAWRKLKLLKQQEFVIGGWTEPRQTRTHFGSLLVGYYDREGALRWAGAVGTGFDQRELDRVAALLKKIEIDRSPFADAFRTAERAHWVKPVLVAEVRFTEWTSDGLLRQPVYLGTREDKVARRIEREEGHGTAASATGASSAGRKAGDNRVGKSARTKAAELRAPVAGRAGARSAAARSAGARSAGARSASALDALVARLHALEEAKKDGDLELPGGDTLRVTNLAKMFWPELKITKGDLFRYYVQVSPFLLPVVDDRPLVMKRFPNGVAKQAFYQQRHPERTPPGVRREVLPEHIEPIDEDGPRDRLIGGSLTTLLYMTQLAAISQDPWFSRVSDPAHQDHAAIDLDPGEGATFAKVLDVARWVKDELDRLGIPGVPKTSGSRGLHIYIRLPAGTSYDSGQLLCHIVATIVSTKHPKVATIERMVKRRPRGTVYVDYLQNILGKTLATAYSARATDYAGVSTPLRWSEVAPGLDPRDFTIRTVLPRFRDAGDLWAPVLKGPTVNLAKVIKKAGV